MLRHGRNWSASASGRPCWAELTPKFYGACKLLSHGLVVALLRCLLDALAYTGSYTARRGRTASITEMRPDIDWI